MANDLFGGLGGLMKGLSGLTPQYDPNVKVLNATTKLSDLQKEETEVYVAIGRRIAEDRSADISDFKPGYGSRSAEARGDFAFGRGACLPTRYTHYDRAYACHQETSGSVFGTGNSPFRRKLEKKSDDLYRESRRRRRCAAEALLH